MENLEEAPKRDWFYWLLVAFLVYVAAAQIIRFLDSGSISSIGMSVGSALLAFGLIFGWPLRRKGERISSMPRARAIGAVISLLGAITLVASGILFLVK
jgi:hypothetical protein